MMGGGSDDRFNEMSSKWWAVVVTIFFEMSSKWWSSKWSFWNVQVGGGSDDLFNEMSSKWWAVVVTIFLMKCPVNDGRWSSKWWAVDRF